VLRNRQQKHTANPLPPSVKKDRDNDKLKVNHCERTEKKNIDKTRKPTRKPTRCFLFFCHRTFLKEFLPTHIWHIAFCPTHEPKLRKSQRAKLSAHP